MGALWSGSRTTTDLHPSLTAFSDVQLDVPPASAAAHRADALYRTLNTTVGLPPLTQPRRIFSRTLQRVETRETGDAPEPVRGDDFVTCDAPKAYAVVRPDGDRYWARRGCRSCDRCAVQRRKAAYAQLLSECELFPDAVFTMLTLTVARGVGDTDFLRRKTRFFRVVKKHYGPVAIAWYVERHQSGTLHLHMATRNAPMPELPRPFRKGDGGRAWPETKTQYRARLNARQRAFHDLIQSAGFGWVAANERSESVVDLSQYVTGVLSAELTKGGSLRNRDNNHVIQQRGATREWTRWVNLLAPAVDEFPIAATGEVVQLDIVDVCREAEELAAGINDGTLTGEAAAEEARRIRLGDRIPRDESLTAYERREANIAGWLRACPDPQRGCDVAIWAHQVLRERDRAASRRERVSHALQEALFIERLQDNDERVRTLRRRLYDRNNELGKARHNWKRVKGAMAELGWLVPARFLAWYGAQLSRDPTDGVT